MKKLLLSLLLLPTAAVAEQKIINGTVVSQYNSPVVRIGGCTAAVITPHIMLTAAHCFSATTAFPFAGVIDGQLFLIRGAVLHPNFASHPTLLAWKNDVAIVWTDSTLPMPPFALANNVPVTKGEKLTFRGYGISDKGDDELLRVASSRVSQVSTDHISFDGTKEADPRVCFGDSGGPLIKRFRGKDVIVGVASGGFNLCKANHRTYFTNIQSKSVQRFLKQFLRLTKK
jgi:secreted trypsin-like serine protease